MKVNWTQLGLMVAQLVPLFVGKVQKIKKDAPGPEKQQDVIDLIKLAVQGTELVAGQDLIDDNEVQKAVRAVIDAEVHLKNVIASVHAKKAKSGEGSLHPISE